MPRPPAHRQEILFDAGPQTAENLRLELLIHVHGPSGTTVCSLHVSDHLTGNVFLIEGIPDVRFPLEARQLAPILTHLMELSEIHTRPF